MGDLKVFLYQQCRVLIATEKLDCGLGHVDNKYMHITNRSANESHPDYDEATQNLAMELPLAVLQAEHSAAKVPSAPAAATPKLDDVLGLDKESIVRQMRELIGPLFDRLSRNRRHFFSLPNCYELFGFDFMLGTQ